MAEKKQDKHKDFIMIPLKMLKMKLNPRSILLYGLILKMSYGLTEETYATNRRFSAYIGTSERQVLRCLHELENKECIKIRIDEDNKNLRYIKPLILNEVKYIKENEEDKYGDFETL